MSALPVIGEQKIETKDLLPLLTKYGMLPQLAREIVIDRAIADISCTPEEENLARTRFYQQNQITSDEQVKQWLEGNRVTAEQLNQLVLREIKIEKFKQATWENKLESYFLQVKGQLDKVVYSLLRTQDAGIAQELFFRIQEKENTFAELAKEYSKGAEAQTGGLIGPVELNVPHPQIAQMLSNSKPGQLWPPTTVGDWIIILRLEKYLSSELDPPTRQRLINDLFQQWLFSQMQAVIFPSETLAVSIEEG